MANEVIQDLGFEDYAYTLKPGNFTPKCPICCSSLQPL